MNSVPVNYPLWSWNKSNGSATDAQTVAAYESTTTRGYTADFSRHVWNDLVITLNKLLITAGLEWDEKYTSFPDAQVHVPNGLLTARMFNSVRYNIENASFTAWTWEFDYTQVGYVGRNDFYGVADVGEERADIVYGWYIIELARKLNVLIEFLRGTADIAEMSFIDNSESSCVVDFSVIKVIRLNPENELSRSCLETYMRARKAIALKLEQEISSFLVTDASCDPAVSFLKICHSQSVNETNINRAFAIGISAIENSEVDTEAEMTSGASSVLQAKNTSNSNYKTELREVDVIPIDSMMMVKSSHFVTMLAAMDYFDFDFSKMAESTIEIMLRSVCTLPINFALMSESITTASATVVEIVSLLCSELSYSFISALLANVPPTPVAIAEMSNSVVNADATVNDATTMIAINTSSGISVVRPDTLPPSVLEIIYSAVSASSSSLEKIDVVSIETVNHSESRTVVRMPIWYCPVKKDSDLYVRSVYNEPVRTKNNLHIS